MNVQIHPSWYNVLHHEFEKEYFGQIKSKIRQEKQEGKTIYPKGAHIFAAYNSTPFDEVKVVLLGQDPYHGPNQAHGLSFSVQDGVKPPPSLKNIFKELHNDLNSSIPQEGNLQSWAHQGVLLLNSILTVRANEAASHRNIGWEQFTDATIQALSQQRAHLVFLLWGRFAQEKARLIDAEKHLILQSAHPSPFSAHKGFLGNGHFSKTNDYLVQYGKTAIDWTL